MVIFKNVLAEIYRRFSDEYLLEKLRSGTLIEMAEQVVQEELESRGVSYLPWPPETETVAEPIHYHPLNFVTVASSLNSITMHILRARLEAEGIPAILADANMAQSYSTVSVAVGGVRVQVPADLVENARQIIADINSGALMLTEDDDVGSQLESDRTQGIRE